MPANNTPPSATFEEWRQNTNNIDVDAGEVSNLATTATDLTSAVNEHEGDIIANASGISTNASDIATNASGISTNAGNISTNASGISTNAAAAAAAGGDAVSMAIALGG